MLDPDARCCAGRELVRTDDWGGLDWWTPCEDKVYETWDLPGLGKVNMCRRHYGPIAERMLVALQAASFTPPELN